MGPIEIMFLTIWALFGVIGVIRGYPRELGVTTMLLLALFVTQLVGGQSQAKALSDRILGIFIGTDAVTLTRTRMILNCAFLVVVAFISYEGDTLVFRGKRGKLFFDLGSGLLNGYLLVGSLWYYLHVANWPFLPPISNFSAFYNTILNFLPPAVFTWPYLIGLVVLMLIIRFWK